MKKGEKLQQQCIICKQWFDKDIIHFRKYSKKTNGLNFHNSCRQCEDQQKLNEEWKDGKLLCHICNQYKDTKEFTFAGDSKYPLRDNKDARCNSCKVSQRKNCILSYDDTTKLEKVLQARWLGAKDRATNKSIPFTITKEDLLTLWNIQGGKCAISNLDMTYDLGEGRVYTNVSIDQIEPSKGYTIDNIQLVCMAVNQLKSDFSMDIIFTICEAVYRNAAKWHH